MKILALLILVLLFYLVKAIVVGVSQSGKVLLEGINESKDVLQVAMTLLNYHGDNNFLIGPVHNFEVNHFDEYCDLKKCYSMIKYLKNIENIKLSSYRIKKVLLSEEMKILNEEQYSVEILEEALKHVGLKLNLPQLSCQTQRTCKR